MVERASRRVPMAEVKVGSAEAIPFPDDSFSAVITISAFHHWADRAAGLEECRRVLEPGGKVYVVEGALRDGKDGHGLDTRGAEVLAAKLIELGFTDTDTDELKTGWRHSYFVVSGVAP